MLDLRLYDAVNPLPSYSGNELENRDDAQGLARREVEIDTVNSSAINSVADSAVGLRTKVELTKLISRLMGSEDPEALRREYGCAFVEEAISVLENRI